MQRPRGCYIQELCELGILLIALHIRLPQKHTVKLKSLGLWHREHHHAFAESALVRICQRYLMAGDAG